MQTIIKDPYTIDLIFDKEETEDMNELLEYNPFCWEDHIYGENFIESYGATYPDGAEADIRIFGVEYEAPTTDKQWDNTVCVEGRLYTDDNDESEGDNGEKHIFWGKWEFEAEDKNGNKHIYILNIIPTEK